MRIYLISLLSLILAFTACNVDDTDMPDPQDTEQTTDEQDRGDDNEDEADALFVEGNDCFEIVYPIAYTLPDDTVIEGDRATLRNLIAEYYASNPDLEVELALVFPIQIIYADNDALFDISSDEQLERHYNNCEESERGATLEILEENDCFGIIYPISLILPDGTTIEGSKADLENGLQRWYNANPDEESAPIISYPINVSWYLTDTRVTIDSQEALRSLYARCNYVEDEDNFTDRNDCYELIYPVSYLLPDGSSVTGDAEYLESVIADWYDSSPATDRRPQLQFPVDLIWLETGELITAETEDLFALINERCSHEDDGRDDEEEITCFELIYPISIIFPNQEIITADNEEALDAAIERWYTAHPDFREEPNYVYPIEIAFWDRDIVIVINNNEELRRAYAFCDEDDTDFDCPELRADVGDACRKDDGTEGTINDDCLCI